MYLTQLHPELLSKTIWANMSDFQKKVIWHIITCEKEFGKPLPNDSFYKMIAIRQVKMLNREFAHA